jgi:hypothetical protein
MANRYWVGGSGTWNTTSTANWSASSGGAAGASAPTSADAVFIDASSGNGTVTLGENVSVLSLTLTGFTGTLNWVTYKISLLGTAAQVFTGATTYTVAGTPLIDLAANATTSTRTVVSASIVEANSISFKVSAGSDTVAISNRLKDIDFTGFSGTLTNGSRTLFGSLTLSSTMTLTAGANATNFRGTTGGFTVTSSGKTMDFPLNFDSGAGTYTLADNLSVGATRAFTLTSGTLNANGYNVSCGTFATAAGTAKILNLGSGTWTVSGASWDASVDAVNVTVIGVGTISMTSASAKTFAGGGKTYGTLNQGGSGALTITGANTFANITNTVQPATITFPASTTTTVSAFGVSGTSGNQITLNSSTIGIRATINRASGLTNLSNVSIKDINATGFAFFSYLFNGNTNDGNNAGIRFNLPDSSYAPAMFI